MTTTQIIHEWDFGDLLMTMHPHLFEMDSVKNMPEGRFCEDMALALDDWDQNAYPLSAPSHIRFERFHGDLKALHEAVLAVDDGWVQYYTEDSPAYVAYDGDKVVSFATISDMGTYKGLKIGGPGCVGTVPEYRRQGIGLKVVAAVTQILKEKGFDVSYIFYTGVAPWYAKLGYKTVTRWGAKGLLETLTYPSKEKKIAVYCGSTPGNKEIYCKAAYELGQWMGTHGYSLVYGGSNTGLMGAVADGVLDKNGKVIGVVPNVAEIQGRIHPEITQLIETETMADRKSEMIRLSDAFIALPGGLGTLDEITEILSLQSLKIVHGPVIFYNMDGYYEPVKAVLSNILNSAFGRPEYFVNVTFADNIEDIAKALN